MKKRRYIRGSVTNIIIQPTLSFREQVAEEYEALLRVEREQLAAFESRIMRWLK